MKIENQTALVVDAQKNEHHLVTFNRYHRLYNTPSPELDIISEMAANKFDAPLAFISLIDDKKEWLQSSFGLELQNLHIDHSLNAHLLIEPMTEPSIILDLKSDKRFTTNPLVTDKPNLRFKISVPLVMDGEKIGTICVADTTARSLVTTKQIQTLQKLGKLSEKILETQRVLHENSLSETIYQKEIKRHLLAIRASNVVSWLWNLETDHVECDEALRELFGIEHNRPLSGEEIISKIDERDRKAVVEDLERSMKLGEDFDTEFRITDTGRWLIGQGSVLDRNETGEAVSIAGVNIDISDQKNSEEKTDLLLRELNHRVKNTLAMLQSIASQTLKNSRTPEEFKHAFSGRVRSIAAAHTLLSDKEWEPIDLWKLIRDQVTVYVDDLDKQLLIEGEEVTLGPEESLALGMVLHELTTNAAKYGGLSQEGGKVKINVDIDATTTPLKVILDWTEIGGPTVVEPEKNGFGSIMIKRSLDKIMGSHVDLEFSPDGVHAKISMPILKDKQK